MNTDWYCEDFWKGTTKFWNITSCDYEVVNLGSNSGKYAFCYDGLSVKGMNWAIGPQSLVHDFNILKNYFSYLKEGGIVLIPLCPFSCLYSPYNKESNFKYYPILHPATIIDFDDIERTQAYKIKSSPFKEMPMYCLKNTVKEVLKKIIFKIRGKSKINYETDAKMWINIWQKQFNIVDLEAPMSEIHKMERYDRASTLREMISFCKERNLRPYIVLPPIHPLLRFHLSSSFLKNYVYDFLIEAGVEKSILLDFFYSEEFCLDEYFQNSYFLNRIGASLFTKELIKQLEI